MQLLRFLVAEGEAAQLNDKSGWRLSRVVGLESTLAVAVLRLLVDLLTHLPLDKMAAISQTIISFAFLWMKIFYFD